MRDVDVLAEAARRADVSVTFSVPTLDHEIWRRTEPGTAPPRQRLRALSRLVEAGIDARVGMAPILPGLSDRPELLAEVVREARAAGATGIWANLLYLRPGTREHFLAALDRDWPELLPKYERLYRRGAYLPRRETDPVRERVRALARSHGVRDRRRVRLEPPAQARSNSRSPLCDSGAPIYDLPAVATSEITCLIVDDHEVVREGLRLSLSRAPHIRVDRRGRRRRGRRRARRAPPARTS